MDFDDRLQSAFDALTERLHHEIAAQFTAARADLSESARTTRETAVADAANQARAAAEEAALGLVEEATTRAGADARAEIAAGQQAASERLVEAFRSIDAAPTLSQVLDLLVVVARAEARRAAIFLPHGSALKSWRLAGFDDFGALDSSVELPDGEGGVIGEAFETGRLIHVDPGGSHAAALPAFVNLPDQSRALAVPLMMGGQAFAVLYADEGNNEPAVRASWPATIEVLARHAARSLEAITASRLAQVTEVPSR